MAKTKAKTITIDGFLYSVHNVSINKGKKFIGTVSVPKPTKETFKQFIDAGIIDLYRIKPLNEELLLDMITKTRQIVTIEENFLGGGIGSIIASLIADRGVGIRLKRLGIPEQYFSQGGGREVLLRLGGLDVAGITENVLKWLKEK